MAPQPCMLCPDTGAATQAGTRHHNAAYTAAPCLRGVHCEVARQSLTGSIAVPAVTMRWRPAGYGRRARGGRAGAGLSQALAAGERLWHVLPVPSSGRAGAQSPGAATAHAHRSPCSVARLSVLSTATRFEPSQRGAPSVCQTARTHGANASLQQEGRRRLGRRLPGQARGARVRRRAVLSNLETLQSRVKGRLRARARR